MSNKHVPEDKIGFKTAMNPALLISLLEKVVEYYTSEDIQFTRDELDEGVELVKRGASFITDSGLGWRTGAHFDESAIEIADRLGYDEEDHNYEEFEDFDDYTDHLIDQAAFYNS